MFKKTTVEKPSYDELRSPMIAGKISVIMPAFNEAAHIVANVAETVRTLENLNYDFEVIVVDDGSADKTHIEALKAKASFPSRVRVVRYDRNKGKGNALSAGVAHSRGEYVVFLDADMDLHPEQLPVFFAILMANGADAVIGSKFHPASNVAYPWRRRILSYGYYMLIRTLFGLPVRDTQTGLKVFRRRFLDVALPFTTSNRFAFDLELLAIMQVIGAKFSDAPVTLKFQRTLSRIDLKTAFEMLLETLAIYGRLLLASHMIRHIAKAVRLEYIGHEHDIMLIGESRFDRAERDNAHTADEQLEPTVA